MAPIDSLNPDSSLWDWIACDLRFYRERDGLSLAQLGMIMGAQRQTVSNIEHARPGWRLNDDQAKKLDKHWDLNGHFRRLLLYARLGHNPDWYRQYVHFEARADVLRTYESLLIPGLLQTPDYIRTALTEGHEKDVEGNVKARVARQEILHRPSPPWLWVLLDEVTLIRPVGGAVAMRSQLTHLLDMAEMPRISIRVVPLSQGVHLGLDGAFKIIKAGRQTVAYTEAAGPARSSSAGRLVLDSTEVVDYNLRFDLIGAKALSEDASADLIRRTMKGME